jgi:hypothetical protein
VGAATASGRDIAARAPPVPSLGLYGYFFARTLRTLRTTPLPKHFSKRWIAFRFPLVVNVWPPWPPLSHFLRFFKGVSFTATSETRRLSRFLVRRWPPSLSFVFFVHFLFCSQVAAFYPPFRRTRRPSPLRAHQAPLLTVATATHDDAYMPSPRFVPALARAASPRPSRLHPPHRLHPPFCLHYSIHQHTCDGTGAQGGLPKRTHWEDPHTESRTFSFLFFLLTSSFAV